MAFPWAAAVGFAGSLAEGFLGASAAKDAETDARRNANQARIQTYNQQVGDYQFNQANQQLTYDFAVATARLGRDIERAIATQAWETQRGIDAATWITQNTNLQIENLAVNAQNQRNVDFQRTLQAADQRQQMRLFEQSEQTYSLNTQLIAQAAQQAFSYQKDRLRFERLGLDLQRQELGTRFGQSKRETTNQLAAQRARYTQELKQAGLTGESLQKAVKRRMQEFTQQQEVVRREASQVSAQAAATGKQGASQNRLMADPMNQAALAIGALGVELAYFGEEKEIEMMKLAAATNLAGVLADNERQILTDRLNNEAALTNIAFEQNRLQERQAIFETNNNLEDTRLQAQSQMNQALSNRELRPLDPVQIQDPLEVPRAFLPKPFEVPKPLAARKGIQPLMPNKPLAAPAPVLGAQQFSSASAAPGILASGVFNALGNVAQGVNSWQQSQSGNIQPKPSNPTGPK